MRNLGEGYCPGGGGSRGFGASSELLAALSGRVVWPQLGQTLMKGVGRDQEFRVAELYERGGPRSGVSGSRTLRDVRHAIRMITILIHIHVHST